MSKIFYHQGTRTRDPVPKNSCRIELDTSVICILREHNVNISKTLNEYAKDLATKLKEEPTP